MPASIRNTCRRPSRARATSRICDFGAGFFREPQADVPIPSRGGNAWVLLKESPWPNTMNIPEYAARIIRDGLDVPVGIIHVAVPGTNQAAWMSRPSLEKFPGKDGPDFYKELFTEHEAKLLSAAEKFKTWQDVETAEAAWQAKNKTEMPVKAFLAYANFPSVLYNTRIHPLAPMAIHGVMWHQGEAGPGGPYDAPPGGDGKPVA